VCSNSEAHTICDGIPGQSGFGTIVQSCVGPRLPSALLNCHSER
jgi:hypothetical protein